MDAQNEEPGTGECRQRRLTDLTSSGGNGFLEAK
jgi:hypothetical protein